MKDFQVVQASSQDWPEIKDLFKQVVTWLSDKGSSQWQGLLSGHDAHRTQDRVHAGEVYVGRNKDGALLTCFILYDEQSDWDASIWGADDSQDFAYLHRLAVNRDFSGQGVGSLALDAAKKIARRQGKEALRLDCRESVASLNRLYQKNAFQCIGTQSIYDGDDLLMLNLYEYPLLGE